MLFSELLRQLIAVETGKQYTHSCHALTLPAERAQACGRASSAADGFGERSSSLLLTGIASTELEPQTASCTCQSLSTHPVCVCVCVCVVPVAQS